MNRKEFEEVIAKLLESEPFSTEQDEKEQMYTELMYQVNQIHLVNCPEYRKIWEAFGCEMKESVRNLKDFRQFPPLPVSLFKKYLLSSIRQEEIYKILTSSGTTGTEPSKVPLDMETASIQQKALAKLILSFLGDRRMPMLIIDSEKVLKKGGPYTARAAGILGFSLYGSRKCFALDEDMTLNMERVQVFLEKYKGQRILVFGFTFLIWQRLYLQLKKQNSHLDLSRAFLIHGGGWKRLKTMAVSEDMFRDGLAETCSLTAVYNYYGMAEQTGGIYIECEYHHFHASIFSEVIIRNMQDFSLCDIGEEGIIQVMTPLALSFPGHNLLTEDKGVVLGVDDCPCGRKGKYFKLIGRIKQAEIRGCSDVYAE